MTDEISPMLRSQISSGLPIGEGIIQPESDEERIFRHVEQLLNGGTFEQGLLIPRAIIARRDAGLNAKHCLIVQAQKTRGNILTAEDIPINRGIVEGFGMPAESINDLVGNTVIELGKSGLIAFLQPLWFPKDELTEAECNGMKKRFLGENGEHTNSGIIVYPKFALRAVFQNLGIDDPAMQANPKFEA